MNIIHLLFGNVCYTDVRKEVYHADYQGAGGAPTRDL